MYDLWKTRSPDDDQNWRRPILAPITERVRIPFASAYQVEAYVNRVREQYGCGSAQWWTQTLDLAMRAYESGEGPEAAVDRRLELIDFCVEHFKNYVGKCERCEE